MKYLYTKNPDDECKEVEPGVYGRPVHTCEQAKLRKLGWAYSISELKGDDYVRQEKEGRKEEVEVTDDRDMWVAAYEQKFGRKPHHKLKTEKIRQKVESDG